MKSPPRILGAALAIALGTGSAMAQNSIQASGVYDSHNQFVGTGAGQGYLTRMLGPIEVTMQWSPLGFADQVILYYTDGQCRGSTPYIDAEMPPAMSYWYGTPNAVYGPTSGKAQNVTLQSMYYYDGASQTAQCYGGFSVEHPMVPAGGQTIKVFYPPFCAVPAGGKLTNCN